MQKRQCVLTSMCAALLCACSSAPGPKDIPPNTEFTTHMLDDGTKLFTLKLQPQMGHGHGGGGPMRQQGGDRNGAGGGDCFPCEPGESGGGRGGARGDARGLGVDMKAIAEAMIAENHYCRDGFVVLEQFQQEHARVMRGECRDSADDNDRARFTR